MALPFSNGIFSIREFGPMVIGLYRTRDEVVVFHFGNEDVRMT